MALQNTRSCYRKDFVVGLNILKYISLSPSGSVATTFLSAPLGHVPEDWKNANITPVFKKGNKHLPSNYHPISLTSLVVKVIERLIHRRSSNFLEENGKLNPAQHGFRGKHSCQSQLLESVHKWTSALDSGDSSHIIFLDSSKAFNTVPHAKLCHKLGHIGIRGKMLTWTMNFLSNRRQRVVVNGSNSKWTKVTSGVPQGSILGPLLFLVYINVIGDCLKHSEVHLFTDDCTISRTIKENDDCSLLQQDLTELHRCYSSKI